MGRPALVANKIRVKPDDGNKKPMPTIGPRDRENGDTDCCPGRSEAMSVSWHNRNRATPKKPARRRLRQGTSEAAGDACSRRATLRHEVAAPAVIIAADGFLAGAECATSVPHQRAAVLGLLRPSLCGRNEP